MIDISDAPVQAKKAKKAKKDRKPKEDGASTDSDSEAKSFGRRDSQSSVNSDASGNLFAPNITQTYQVQATKYDSYFELK